MNKTLLNAVEETISTVSITPAETTDVTLEARINYRREQLARAESIIKKRGEEIKLSEERRCRMMKDIDNGVSFSELIIQAAEIIRIITGDEVFYNHIARGVKAREGSGKP